MSTEGENVPRLMPAFTRETGIAVDVQALPWTAAHEKVLTAHAGGSLPDVLMVSNRWIAELAMLRALAPVPGARDGFFPMLRDAVNIEGRTHASPWTALAQVQFFRRDLVRAVGYDTPPEDWSDWLTMARALKRRAPDNFAVLLLLDWPEQLFNFAAQQPGRLLRDRDTRGNFSSPGFRTALAFYKSIFDQKLAPPIAGAEFGDTLTAFGRGWFAVLPSAADTIGDLRRREAQIPPNSWGTAVMPGPSGPTTGMIDGTSLAVTATARDPVRARALVDYLCRADTQLALYGLTGDLPSRPRAWTQPALADDPIAHAFARQLARGVSPPAVPEWQRITTEVQAIAERMVRGEFGVDAAARAMDARVDAILAKRRWLLDKGLLP